MRGFGPELHEYFEQHWKNKMQDEQNTTEPLGELEALRNDVIQLSTDCGADPTQNPVAFLRDRITKDLVQLDTLYKAVGALVRRLTLTGVTLVDGPIVRGLVLTKDELSVPMQVDVVSHPSGNAIFVERKFNFAPPVEPGDEQPGIGDS